MRLFLAPARINNIKSTIQKRVPFSLIENKIPLDKYNKIWSGIKNSLGFYCWAMQSGRSETCFRKMRENDIVLIKSKGDPCFKYKGRVVLTLDCIELGNLLWSEGGNWEFIYFFEEIEEISIDLHVLSVAMGYEEEHFEDLRKKGKPDEPYESGLSGTRTNSDSISKKIIQKYGSIENLLSKVSSGETEEFANSSVKVSPLNKFIRKKEVVESEELLKLKSRFSKIIKRIHLLKESNNQNERNNASLVEDFYEILGYEKQKHILFEQGRIDVLIQKNNKPFIVNEVKREWSLNIKDEKVLRQAFGYAMTRRGVPLVVITNGDLYALYDQRKSGICYEDKFISSFKLTELKQEDCAVIKILENLEEIEDS